METSKRPRHLRASDAFRGTGLVPRMTSSNALNVTVVIGTDLGTTTASTFTSATHFATVR